MPVDAANIEFYAPRFKIEINSAELAAEVSHTIQNVEIVKELNKPNSFRFVVQDEFKGGAFKWLGHDLFKYGNSVSIHMGYTNNMIKMLEGKIQKITADFIKGTAPTFTVDGADNPYTFLTTPSGPKVFRDKTDSAIVEEIAEMAHLEAVVDATEEVAPRKTKKGGKSYLQFLEDLTAANKGYEFFLAERRLNFVKAKQDAKSLMTLTWGKELINFRPALNTTEPYTEVVVRAWDRSGKKLIEGRARAGEEQKQEEGKRLASQIAREIYGDVVKVFTNKPVRTVAEAQREAQKELDKASNNFITGSAETIGIPELQLRVCLSLDGLGDWFSGKYYIKKITHRIDQNGYRSLFEVRRNAL